MTSASFRFYVDRGGTFTDIIAVAPDGVVFVHKLLSSTPGSKSQSDATVAGIEQILDYARQHCHFAQDALRIESVKAGTTVATNALLTRLGANLTLITNKGFGDALQIGYQARPDIFALNIKKAEALYSKVIEIDCRTDVDGLCIQPLDTDRARAQLLAIYRQDPDAALAIVLMHGYKYPDHEITLGAIASEIGFKQISLSHQVSQQIKFVGRGDTTCVDAYLTPVLSSYTATLAHALKESELLFIKSDGGLTSQSTFSGKDALLSGPAGGVVGAVNFARQHTDSAVVGFDMGGTSTDVCYFDGQYERLYETTISGVRVRTPMMAVHTVASGGGSILSFDGARLLVGPESAGAYPGPACYGHDGPLTVTDANLVLGRICISNFPRTFGKSLQEPLDKERSIKLFRQLGDTISLKTSLMDYRDIAKLASGYLAVATEKMSRALFKVSTERGHDITRAVLVAFGGAGGQHACMIASRLDIKTILISPLAGVLSAYGIGQAPQTKTLLHSWLQSLDTCASPDLAEHFDQMTEELKSRFAIDHTECGSATAFTATRRLFLHYTGADTSLPISFDDAARETLQERFEADHRRLFGFVSASTEIMISALELELKLDEKMRQTSSDCRFISYQDEAVTDEQDIYAAGKWHKIKPLTRKDLKPGLVISAPALIADATGATVIEPGWQGEILSDGTLKLTRSDIEQTPASLQNDDLAPLAKSAMSDVNHEMICDPVKLELYNNIFMAIAEEMGQTLQQVSHSVNIKERLDFSCAVFDGAGRLIANAPHMPVHLGSMGEAVVSLIKAHGDSIACGDVYLSNNPYNGGTHLPDITAISPVFIEEQDKPVFFVASRGHHADIGGITPGSMPPLSKSILEEGAMLDNALVVQDGALLEDKVRHLFLDNPYPARNIEQTISDLKAQFAANYKGIAALSKLARERGAREILAYMDFARENARQAIVEILSTLEDGEATSTMDDGSIIKVAIRLGDDKQTCTIDFSGTSASTDNNFNTPKAVVRAAVLYVFRTLTRQDIPLNDGCSIPLSIIIPEQSLLAPQHPHAVVAGNVETSQAIVDALYRALGRLADSQGTMNNFTFGNERYQYYETVCGGAGAGEGFDGASAVQTHMTNSRLTDPEILESRYPVLLEEFSLRPRSGGTGRYQGGAGTVRRLRFKEDMTASILSNRRKSQPQGIKGGGNAMSGETRLLRQNGEMQTLNYVDSVAVSAGDAIEISTPGGGGYGAPDQ